MKTDELVTMLAAAAGPAGRHETARRHWTALGWGLFGATLLLAVLLGARDDLADAARLPMFWVKLAFPLGVAAAALACVQRLARPGVRLGFVPAALAAPVLAMWVLGALELLAADPGQREALVYGQTWRECPVYVALIAAPVWVAVMWASKGLAPTRLALAGGMGGLLAGAVGAAVYAIHCTEMAAPFLGLWYLLGMLIPAALGALAGPWLLRW